MASGKDVFDDVCKENRVEHWEEYFMLAMQEEREEAGMTDKRESLTTEQAAANYRTYFTENIK